MGLAESAGGKKRRNDRKLEEKKSKDVVNEIAEDEDEDEDEKEDEEAECEDDECGERESEPYCETGDELYYYCDVAEGEVPRGSAVEEWRSEWVLEEIIEAHADYVKRCAAKPKPSAAIRAKMRHAYAELESIIDEAVALLKNPKSSTECIDAYFLDLLQKTSAIEVKSSSGGSQPGGGWFLEAFVDEKRKDACMEMMAKHRVVLAELRGDRASRKKTR